MIKKQFTQGGGIDLNGMTVTAQSGTQNCMGFAFPKIKTLASLTFNIHWYGYSLGSSSGGSDSKYWYIGDGNTRTQMGYVSCSWRKNQWGGRSLTVPAGRTFSQIWMDLGAGGTTNFRRCYWTVTFDNVEMVDE